MREWFTDRRIYRLAWGATIIALICQTGASIFPSYSKILVLSCAVLFLLTLVLLLILYNRKYERERNHDR